MQQYSLQRNGSLLVLVFDSMWINFLFYLGPSRSEGNIPKILIGIFVPSALCAVISFILIAVVVICHRVRKRKV